MTETLLANPAFRTYALCTCVLALKMLFSAFYTGAQRQRSQGYVNAEDARVFGGTGTAVRGDEAPAVAHALRIQRNDLENIPAFFAVGLVYVLAGATPLGAAAYFWTFTAARILHTVAYLRHLQPWRAACYGVGVLCLLGMIAHVVRAAL
jgi:prostaglandin-E synthase 1